MNKKIVLGLVVLAFGFVFALPTQAAEPTTDQLTLRELIHQNTDYEVINTESGVIINLTSSNPNWVEKIQEKYDSLPKTSKLIAYGQVKIELFKIDAGVQIVISALYPSNANYQQLVEKIQEKASIPKVTYYRILRTRWFLKNHFNSWL